MIKGLSDRRRVPRLGKIRLGVMGQEPGKKAYPKATSYLVCPPEVEKVFGEKPTRLDIMFPADDAAVIFSQELKMYRTSGLYCAGNNERARRWDEQGNLKEIPCPCAYLESGECGPVATRPEPRSPVPLPDLTADAVRARIAESRKLVTKGETA